MAITNSFGVSPIDDWIVQHWHVFVNWLSTPHVYWTLIAWVITFTVLMFIGLSLGFGPAGIVAGSAAAAFQSAVYGGFTPASGLFATLTSLAMLGWLVPWLTLIAATVASVIAVVVWNTW